jgi:hypothetical protein
MQYTLTVAKLKRNCNLIAYLYDLALGEVLATVVSTCITIHMWIKTLRRSSQHLNLSIQIFASIVVHEER